MLHNDPYDDPEVQEMLNTQWAWGSDYEQQHEDVWYENQYQDDSDELEDQGLQDER